MLSGAATPVQTSRSSRIFTARFVLPEPSLPAIEGGALLVEEGRIRAIGNLRDLAAAHPDLPRVDFGDAVLLPPMVNAHTHLELTRFPRWAEACGEAADPAEFVDWILRMIRVKRATPPKELAQSLAEGIRLCYAAGTGAVGDILSSLPARSAYRQTRLRGCCYLETLGRDPETNRQRLEAIAQVCREEPPGRLQVGISPHSLYTLDEEHLRWAFELARKCASGASLHFAESAVESALLRGGGGPLADLLFPAVGWQDRIPGPDDRSLTDHLEACEGLAPSTLLVHAVKVGEEDIAAIARSGAAVVLCPRSNARLGVGLAPVELYLQEGVPLALGTDSLASCDSLSIWEEIAFARQWFGGILGPAQLLAMATTFGAALLGLHGEMGRLAPGWGAHFQVVEAADLRHAADLPEELVERAGTLQVKALHLDGVDVLHNG